MLKNIKMERIIGLKQDGQTNMEIVLKTYIILKLNIFLNNKKEAITLGYVCYSPFCLGLKKCRIKLKRKK